MSRINLVASISVAFAAATLLLADPAYAGKRTYSGNLCHAGHVSHGKSYDYTELAYSPVGFRWLGPGFVVHYNSGDVYYEYVTYICPMPYSGDSADPVSIDVRYFDQKLLPDVTGYAVFQSYSGVRYESALVDGGGVGNAEIGPDSRSMIVPTDTGNVPSGSLQQGAWTLQGYVPTESVGSSGIFSYTLLTN